MKVPWVTVQLQGGGLAASTTGSVTGTGADVRFAEGKIQNGAATTNGNKNQSRVKSVLIVNRVAYVCETILHTGSPGWGEGREFDAFSSCKGDLQIDRFAQSIWRSTVLYRFTSFQVRWPSVAVIRRKYMPGAMSVTTSC